MEAVQKVRGHVQFQDSFGFLTDPFPTLLAGTRYPFAFYFADDPGGGCIRFPTELESERLMGLPDGWTLYGADGGGNQQRAAIPRVGKRYCAALCGLHHGRD